jgi:hypothetical protein
VRGIRPGVARIAVSAVNNPAARMAPGPRRWTQRSARDPRDAERPRRRRRSARRGRGWTDRSGELETHAERLRASDHPSDRLREPRSMDWNTALTV